MYKDSGGRVGAHNRGAVCYGRIQLCRGTTRPIVDTLVGDEIISKNVTD